MAQAKSTSLIIPIGNVIEQLIEQMKFRSLESTQEARVTLGHTSSNMLLYFFQALQALHVLYLDGAPWSMNQLLNLKKAAYLMLTSSKTLNLWITSQPLSVSSDVSSNTFPIYGCINLKYM